MNQTGLGRRVVEKSISETSFIMEHHRGSTRNNSRSVKLISLLLIVLSIICLIVNYAVEQRVSWALYPIGGMGVVWATVVPALVLKKYQVTGSLLGLTLTVIPFLFLIQTLVPTKGWFLPLALPIALLFVIALGASLFALLNRQMNMYYAVALTLFLFGVVVNLGVAFFVFRYLGEEIVFDSYRVSTLSIALLLSLILIVMGFMKQSTGTDPGS